MFKILFSIIGAFLNRVRGGHLADLIRVRPKPLSLARKLKLWDEEKQKLNYVKDFNFFCLSAYICSSQGWIFLPVFYGSLKLAFSFGWGNYIGAIVNGTETLGRDDVKIIDKYIFDRPEIPLLARGILAMTARGLILSLCLYLGFVVAYFFGNDLANPLIAFIGLPMGLIYWIAKLISKSTWNIWGVGEYLFGAYLWLTLGIIL